MSRDCYSGFFDPDTMTNGGFIFVNFLHVCSYTVVTVLFQYILPLVLINVIYCKIYNFLKVTRNDGLKRIGARYFDGKKLKSLLYAILCTIKIN